MSFGFNTQRIGFTYIWKIKNFSLFIKLPKTEEICSPRFIADNLNGTCWYLKLSPVGFSQENPNKYLFRLCKEDSSNYPNTIMLDYELSILNTSDSKEKLVSVSKFWFHGGNTRGKHLCIAPEGLFSERDILQEDSLTVQCKMWHHEKQCLEPGFTLARTRIGFERKSFTWNIDKFSTLQVDDTKSVSVVSFSNQESINLTLTFCVDGGPASGEKMLIKIVGKNEKRNCSSTLDISVQNKNGEPVHRFQNYFSLEKENKQWWFPLILERKTLIEEKDLLLPGDVLSLKCDLIIYGFDLHRIELAVFGRSSACELQAAITNQNRPFRLGKRKRETNSLTNDLRYLFEEKKHTDVTLRVQNETFPVHKAILTARSPVFKTMFDTDMKEKMSDTIEIEDIEPDTMRQLLLYMYSDTLDSDIQLENAPSLYLAAEKYSILGLKERCSSHLMVNLSVTNVCETLVLADRLSDEVLKNFVLSFIRDKDKIILKSEEWKQFAMEHKQLTVDILTYLYRDVKKF